MREPFVHLCSEITREHARTLIRWLEDGDVRRYLRDTADVSASIARVLDKVHLSVLTHLFNQDGQFYMVCDQRRTPVGFVRLIVRGADTEIVIVIGDRQSWGRRLGTGAIRESLKLAFFEQRSQRVVAKIHRENARSIRVFTRAGFRLTQEAGALQCFAITLPEYLALIKQQLAAPGDIIITPIDKARLTRLIAGATEDAAASSLAALQREISRAQVMDMAKIAPDIVTMNSRLQLALNGEKFEVALVYPSAVEADDGTRRMSILSPVGTAILGFGEGDSLRWETPDGMAAIQIGRVLYQPEAAGDYHL